MAIQKDFDAAMTADNQRARFLVFRIARWFLATLELEYIQAAQL